MWGSFWKDGQWGYKCCNSFIKVSVYNNNKTNNTVIPKFLEFQIYDLLPFSASNFLIVFALSSFQNSYCVGDVGRMGKVEVLQVQPETSHVESQMDDKQKEENKKDKEDSSSSSSSSSSDSSSEVRHYGKAILQAQI